MEVDSGDRVTVQQFQSLRFLTANSATLFQTEWENRANKS
jgi:hypothetical protein